MNNEDDDDQDLTGLPLSLTSDASWGECAELLARAARRTRNWKLGYMAEWAWARAIGKAGPAGRVGRLPGDGRSIGGESGRPGAPGAASPVPAGAAKER